ncbi:hypothetical protein ACROYT_G002260 [Oculina patagonica]
MMASWSVLLLASFSLLVTAENTNPDLFDDEKDIVYEKVGCFKDTMEKPRPLPVLVKNYRWPSQIDWKNLDRTIRACAKEVKKAGYLYFGLQFYGECWSGPQAHSTYDEDGKSKHCMLGVGKERANFVYKLVFKECNEYKVLQTADRSVHHTYTPSAACDVSLKPAWYRFQGKAGNAMANSCPPQFKCGTIVPGWLDGELPSVQEGVVSRKVCFHQNRDCCYAPEEAKVRNCGGFYVYYLRPAPYCQLRYCGNGRRD